MDKNSSCLRLLVSFLFFTLSKMYRSIGQIAFRCHFVDFKFLYDVHYDAVMTWRHKCFFRLHRTLVFVSGTYHQTFCSVHRTLAWPLDFEMTTGLSNVTIYVYIYNVLHIHYLNEVCEQHQFIINESQQGCCILWKVIMSALSFVL